MVNEHREGLGTKASSGARNQQTLFKYDVHISNQKI